MRFRNRIQAGKLLGDALQHLRDEPAVVLGLPRGGVPVASEVARALHAPLDVMLVRKLGVPRQPELAMGAIGEDGVRILNDTVIRLGDISSAEIAAAETRERAEIDRRATLYRGTRPRLSLEGRTAVVVDDGLATGATARAGCAVARLHGAEWVVLAVPVAPHDWVDHLGDAADECISLHSPRAFESVGQFYDDFRQTTDEEVVALLRAANSESG
jgi:predicted phosphoribosyltransferase